MATDAMVNSDQLLRETLQRLQQKATGPYGTDAIRQGINEFQNLDNLVKSGAITQKDYVNIADQIKSYLQPIGNVSTQGSAGASAATGAGWYDIQNNYRNANIYREASNLLGRDLTQNEFARFAPYFGTGSPRDIENGRAALAAFAEQEAKSPQALQAKSGQYSGDVNSIFNDLLKRGASQEEINHFGGLLASGEVDPYTLRQFVQQLPEYTSARDQESRSRLNDELSQYDQQFFSKGKEDVISRYAKAGIQNSPSLDFALTNLMGDIQKERSAYLSKLAREDYSKGRDVQRDDYLTSLNRMFGEQDYGRQKGDAYSNLLLNRSFNSQDYQRQQDDLMRLLSNQPRQKRGGAGQLIGGLAGAGIGYGLTRSPQGAQAGYSIGSGVGGGYDYLNY